MLIILHGLENGLTDGGEVVSLIHLQRSTFWKHFYFCLCYQFLLEAQ
jgi:hypothetical protein